LNVLITNYISDNMSTFYEKTSIMIIFLNTFCFYNFVLVITVHVLFLFSLESITTCFIPVQFREYNSNCFIPVQFREYNSNCFISIQFREYNSTCFISVQFREYNSNCFISVQFREYNSTCTYFISVALYFVCHKWFVFMMILH
jgi:hypothetical protein